MRFTSQSQDITDVIRETKGPKLEQARPRGVLDKEPKKGSIDSAIYKGDWKPYTPETEDYGNINERMEKETESLGNAFAYEFGHLETTMDDMVGYQNGNTVAPEVSLAYQSQVANLAQAYGMPQEFAERYATDHALVKQMAGDEPGV